MLPTTRHLLRKGPVQDCILLFCYPQVTSRLYTTVLLPTDPLLECILLFCYAIANYLTVCYCSVTHRPTARLYATVLLRTDTLPDCILLSCYPHFDYQKQRIYWFEKNYLYEKIWVFDFSKLALVCMMKISGALHAIAETEWHHNCVGIATERFILWWPGNFIGGECLV